jgi:Rps23 Pro-64 3,4-dihydroxylase Tpa1-like proline 4-hydroxylase
MQFVDDSYLKDKAEKLQRSWNQKHPFRYLIINNFFPKETAEHLYQHYPGINSKKWDHTTYINQKNKFVKNTFEDLPVYQQLFEELNDKSFTQLLEKITGVQPLLPDSSLHGAGLHQSTKGAFLDVHIDFNKHPEKKWHRRMNLIIFMNKNWKKEYNGYLELWDMDKKERIENIKPSFNKAVLFETNEISFHGHPKPLNTPPDVSRKSISLYFYSPTQPEEENVPAHNTIFVNTEGTKGWMKNFKSGLKALFERMKVSM